MGQLNAGLPGSPTFNLKPTRAVVNSSTVSGGSYAGVNSAAFMREVLSGALTAGVLKTILSFSGGGEMPFLVLYAKDATARTMQIQVICDGVVVVPAVSSTGASAGNGLPIVGQNTAASVSAQTGSIRWNSNCQVQVSSSLSETDKVAIGYTAMGY